MVVISPGVVLVFQRGVGEWWPEPHGEYAAVAEQRRFTRAILLADFGDQEKVQLAEHTAWCSPEDQFRRKTGMAIATGKLVQKLLGRENPVVRELADAVRVRFERRGQGPEIRFDKQEWEKAAGEWCREFDLSV